MIMSTSQLATLSGIFLCLTRWTMASDFSLIEASADGSHLRFIDAFTNYTENAYREIIAIYDTTIQNDPQNPLLLLEKCKFIEGAFPINYDDGRRNQTELDTVLS